MSPKPKIYPSIPECPAFRICQDRKATCDICLSLPVAEWREHVGKVLDR